MAWEPRDLHPQHDGAAWVHELVSSVASVHPDAIAISSGDAALSYRELEARSRSIAARLKQNGVKPGELVGVYLERSPDAIASILAVMTAGAAYVPLDPAHPAERLEFVLADTGMRAVITSTDLAPRLAGTVVERVCIDEPSPSFADAAFTDTSSSDDLAYVIYTSGSTGRPKGVMVTHGNLAHSTSARFEYYRDPVAAFLLLSPLTFDSSVAGLYWTLCSGGRLVLPPPGVERDPARIAALIEAERVTHLLTLPSFYRLILERCPARGFTSLNAAIVAGEACPVALAAEHQRRLPRAKLFNEYGPTEATVWCTAHEVTGDLIDSRVPIGRPIPRMHCHIVAPNGEPAARGEAGELFVGGPGVAAGYLNRPDLTAERFVPDTFCDRGGRLYRTGDLVRRLPDDTLEFLGRIDHQVKVRGHRIEPGEIEAVLGQHGDVRDVVVMARPQSAGDLRLLAYVVPEAGRTANAGDLHAFLSARLPDYMVPSDFIPMAELPLNSHGKVDRDALPAPGRRRPNLQRDAVPPRTPLERWLVRAWGDILELDEVGIHDPFFDLGGRSLDAARFINQLQDVLGEFVFVVLIYECPTVAALAERLRRDYTAAVARVFNEATDAGAQQTADAPVDDAMVARARQLIGQRTRHRQAVVPSRNPRAVFILSPPRSGTTLLTAMLAGHPDLVAASELNLLGFGTLGERRAACSGTSSVFLEGALRLLMDVHGIPADDAIARMQAAEERDLGVAEFYGDLQRAVAPRLLLDKSPAYGLDRATLDQAEAIFDRPLYVHLCRHPYSTVRSFVERHMEQVYFNHPGFTRRQAAELVWVLTHRNILEFLAEVPSDRHVRVRYEDLVTDPEQTMRALCAPLGLTFHADLLRPYADKDRKIRAGVHADSKSLGDPQFHAFDGITASRVEIDKAAADSTSWGPLTAALARELGYDVREDAPHAPAADFRDVGDTARARQVRDRLAGRRGLRRVQSGQTTGSSLS